MVPQPHLFTFFFQFKTFGPVFSYLHENLNKAIKTLKKEYTHSSSNNSKKSLFGGRGGIWGWLGLGYHHSLLVMLQCYIITDASNFWYNDINELKDRKQTTELTPQPLWRRN